jgi:PAS domain S-box-containing protein
LAIIARTDLNGNIVAANENFCKLSRYSLEELLGKNHRILNSGQHPENFFKDMWKAISAGEIWRGIICNKNKDGEYYWVDSAISPIFDQHNKQITGYMSLRFDVTDDILNKKRILENDKKIILASKMASIGELTASLAHEITNPLAIIKGNLEFISSKMSNDPNEKLSKIEDKVKICSKVVERINNIVGSIMRTSRDASNDNLRMNCLNDIIKDSHSLLESQLKLKSIKFVMDSKITEKTLVNCRYSELVQVFSNLIKNAIDAIPSTGDHWIQINIDHFDEYISVKIMDSGSGIDNGIGDKIFNPLFTTKEEGKGNGLGLSITKKIIESHKGKIFVNKKYENTCFEIHLPKSIR